MSTITSGLYKLGLRDLAHGLIMAAGGAAFQVISESISKAESTTKWVLIFDWNAIIHAALLGSVVYLGKKFFTPAQIIKPATSTN